MEARLMDWRECNELAQAALLVARFVTSSGFARTNCPFCPDVVGKEDRKQCLSISTSTGVYRCWRCGTKGRLKVETGDFIVPAGLKVEEKPVMAPPEGYLPLCEEPACSAESADDARAYLLGRGLPERLWKEARIGVCLSGRFDGRVIIPVLSPDGGWIGWVGRVWVKHHPRAYFNAPGMALGELTFNHKALLEQTDDHAYVMEGVFDALAHWPLAVAVLGKPTEAQVLAMAAARRPVVVVLDGDAWEQGWMLALRLRLEGQRAGAVRLPPTLDPDEVPRADLWEAGRASLGMESGLVSL
jgi:hypothetical protein